MHKLYRYIYLYCLDSHIKKSLVEFLNCLYQKEFFLTESLEIFYTNPFCYILIPTQNDLGISIRAQVIHIRESEMQYKSKYFYPIIVVKNTLSFFTFFRSPHYLNIDIDKLREKIDSLKVRELIDFEASKNEIEEINYLKTYYIRFFNHNLKNSDKAVLNSFINVHSKYFLEDEKLFFNNFQNNKTNTL